MLLRMTGEAAPQPLRFTLLLFWKPEPVEIVPQGRARDLGQGEVWERTSFPKELWGGGISSRNTGKFMWGAHCWELWAGSYLQTNSRKGRKGKERKTFITAGESADRGWKLQREERQSAAPKRPRAQSTSGHMQASTYVKRWWEFNIFKHLFLVAREHPTVHIFFFFFVASLLWCSRDPAGVASVRRVLDLLSAVMTSTPNLATSQLCDFSKGLDLSGPVFSFIK